MNFNGATTDSSVISETKRCELTVAWPLRGSCSTVNGMATSPLCMEMVNSGGPFSAFDGGYCGSTNSVTLLSMGGPSKLV